MQEPKLLIRKAMVNIQGKMRPLIQVQASIDPVMHARLTEHFLNENLFKRSAYATGFPTGVPTPSASLQPHLNNFIKSDACPEIAVKTILAGQVYQGLSVWEMKAFEYVAQRGFDALCDFMKTVAELGTETVYAPEASDFAAFTLDTAAEIASLPASIVPGLEVVADAA